MTEKMGILSQQEAANVLDLYKKQSYSFVPLYLGRFIAQPLQFSAVFSYTNEFKRKTY